METEELAPLEVAELIDIRPDTNALAPLTATVPLDCTPPTSTWPACRWAAIAP
ncbi:MAG: hypothetical protein M9936_31615 [Caldilinea sp.]|nr:hypothetical protein [Caldilinea sp.]